MTPQKIEGATRTLGAPKDWNAERDGECGSLDILDQSAGGVNMMHSVWKPTPEELAALSAGGEVRLTVFGEVHPPVAIGVLAP